MADFFYSMLNLRLPIALALMAAAYLISFMTWALIWHGVYWCAPTLLALVHEISRLHPNQDCSFLFIKGPALFQDTLASANMDKHV